MTDEELKALVASLVKSQQKTDEQLKQTDAQIKETDAQLKETSLEVKATSRELKELFKETDARFKETDAQFKANRQEVRALWEKTDARFKETDQQFKELGKHIGGLGNKFGGFTEALAFPAITKILQEQFGMECIATRVKKRLKNSEVIEVDVLAYSNSASNTVFLVEVKSHLIRESISQFLKTLKQFYRYFPEHRDKALYGILAFVDYRDDFLTQTEEAGLYLASIHDGLFEMKSRSNFQPKNFQYS